MIIPYHHKINRGRQIFNALMHYYDCASSCEIGIKLSEVQDWELDLALRLYYREVLNEKLSTGLAKSLYPSHKSADCQQDKNVLS